MPSKKYKNSISILTKNMEINKCASKTLKISNFVLYICSDWCQQYYNVFTHPISEVIPVYNISDHHCIHTT